MNDTVSEEMHLNRGIPRGSCLGPVQFVIFHQFFYMMSKVNISQMFMAMRMISSYAHCSNQRPSMEMCVSDVRNPNRNKFHALFVNK